MSSLLVDYAKLPIIVLTNKHLTMAMASSVLYAFPIVRSPFFYTYVSDNGEEGLRDERDRDLWT